MRRDGGRKKKREALGLLSDKSTYRNDEGKGLELESPHVSLLFLTSTSSDALTPSAPGLHRDQW